MRFQNKVNCLTNFERKLLSDKGWNIENPEHRFRLRSRYLSNEFISSEFKSIVSRLYENKVI
jgi:hypothetical protein